MAHSVLFKGRVEMGQNQAQYGYKQAQAFGRYRHGLVARYLYSDWILRTAALRKGEEKN